MTKLPLRVVPAKGGFAVSDANDDLETDGYGKKSEAEDARQGLTRFYKAHPEYLTLKSGERTMSTVEAKSVLQVSREDAVALFLALSMKTAPQWNRTRMSEKIASLAKDYDADTALPTPETQATFNAILAAIVEDRAIELVNKPDNGKPDAAVPVAAPESVAPAAPTTDAAPPVPVEGAPVEASAPKKRGRKPKAAGETAAAPATPRAGTDKFGLREGSKASKFAAGLTEAPQTMRELMAKAGDEETHYNVLNKLAESGKVVKTADKKFHLPTTEYR